MTNKLRQPKGASGGVGGQFAPKPLAADTIVPLSLPPNDAEPELTITIGRGTVLLTQDKGDWCVANDAITSSNVRQKFLKVSNPSQIGHDMYASVAGVHIARKLSEGEWTIEYAERVAGGLGDVVDGLYFGALENDLKLGVAECLLEIRAEADNSSYANDETAGVFLEECDGYPGVAQGYLNLEDVFINTIASEVDGASGLHAVTAHNPHYHNPSLIADIYEECEETYEVSRDPYDWEQRPVAVALVMLSQYHKQYKDPSPQSRWDSYSLWLENTALPYRDCWESTVKILTDIIAKGTPRDQELATNVLQEVHAFGREQLDPTYKDKTARSLLTLEDPLQEGGWNAQDTVRRIFGISYLHKMNPQI